MKKLIELLNEYEIEREEKIDLFKDKEKPLWEWYKDCTGDLTFEPTDNSKMNGECFSGDTAHSVIISKSYGFIQRLVDNDKIDRDKCGFKNEGLSGNWYDSGIAFVQNYDNDTYKVSEFYSPYLQLLMLLSISDTPIEDLISYLK